MFNSKKKIQPLSQKELTPMLRRVQKFLVQSSLHSTPKNGKGSDYGWQMDVDTLIAPHKVHKDVQAKAKQ
jgi:hypothetical protein